MVDWTLKTNNQSINQSQFCVHFWGTLSFACLFWSTLSFVCLFWSTLSFACLFWSTLRFVCLFWGHVVLCACFGYTLRALCVPVLGTAASSHNWEGLHQVHVKQNWKISIICHPHIRFYAFLRLNSELQFNHSQVRFCVCNCLCLCIIHHSGNCTLSSWVIINSKSSLENLELRGQLRR